MSDSVRELARRFTEDAWDRRDPAAFDQLLADEFHDHDPVPGQSADRDGFKQMASGFFAAFPDLHVWNEDVIADGDKAAIRWHAEGTHAGELMGIEATGRRVSLKGVDIIRARDGKIVERWGEFDAMSLMSQLEGG